jgi:2-phosphosulfolactate phosphatase
VTSPFAQDQYQVRLDWGIEGAAAIADDADVIVVVDVLSFTTSVEIAVALGADVLPCDPADASGLSARTGAPIAARRGAGMSLAPASISAASLPPGGRVVLPSPNGSRISAALAEHPAIVVAASLRNRAAVAEWVRARQGERGERVTVAIIAAGERRPDGSTRFAVEDLLGAGAVVDALAAAGIDHCSPEAAAASAAFTGLRNAIRHVVGASATGRELADAGHGADIDLATEVDISSIVPVLGEFGFRA